MVLAPQSAKTPKMHTTQVASFFMKKTLCVVHGSYVSKMLYSDIYDITLGGFVMRKCLP